MLSFPGSESTPVVSLNLCCTEWTLSCWASLSDWKLDLQCKCLQCLPWCAIYHNWLYLKYECVFSFIFWLFQCIQKLSFSFSFIKIVSGLLDLTVVYRLYMPVLMCFLFFWNIPIYLWNPTSGNLQVCLSIPYHIQHPSFYSLTLLRLLTWNVTLCYSGLYLYAFKLSQEDLLPVCVIICVNFMCQYYLQVCHAC